MFLDRLGILQRSPGSQHGPPIGIGPSSAKDLLLQRPCLPARFAVVRMTGFGEAVAIIGLTNIAFDQIHKGFVLLRTARNFGEDADRCRRSLEWEHYRYCVWEDKWNGTEGEAKDGSSPLSAKKSMAAQLVQELTSIFPGGEKLEQRYKLKIEPSDEEIDEESARGVLQKFAVHLKLRKDFGLATAKAIHSQSGRMKRWRWAVWDKDRMKEYIEYVTILVSRLLELTALDKPSMPEPALESMIRKIIKISVADQDLHFLRTLHYVPTIPGSSAEEPTTRTLPDLKATRLEYDLDQVPSIGESLEISETPKDSNVLAAKRRRIKQVQKLKLKSGRFHVFPTSTDEAREAGSYMDETVLAERKWSRVEGKANPSTVDERLRHRIEGLVVLLSQLKGPSFHALSLNGFFEEQDSVAFVYRLPQVLPARPQTQDELAYARVQDPNHTLATSTPPHFLTVSQVVGSQLAPPEPSTRLNFARAMAETMLELHTAGWLHKAIRTDNVLLCNLDDALWPNPESFQGPFLAGYMFARENDPREISDEVASSPETDLYRHPSALGEARLSFRPEFDLYALGMVLLEIGLWKNLKEILPTIHEKLRLKHLYGIEDVLHKLDDGGKDSIVKQLRFSNGQNYCDAVSLCLKPQSFFEQQSSVSDEENDDESLDNSVRLQETVLSKLKA